MPWRRFRKKVERPIDVSKSIEESLEDAADGEELEDLTELAELDDANLTEAASGEPDDDRAPSELGDRLRDALATEEQRGGLPSERPLARGTSRSHEGPSEGDPRAATAARYPEIGVDLEVEAARGLRLKNPVMTASGTFGQGVEYAELIDVSRLGAIVNKGTTPAARPGNPQYRIAETPSGILNSIGLENPGAAEVARKYGKAWAEHGGAGLVNGAGFNIDDYVYVVHEMTGTPGVVAYEINVSCPNVKGGMLFGCDPDLAAEVTRAVKAETDLPVIVKLTPNAPDVVAVARACEEAGADALTAINTVLGMRIDTRRRRPILGTGSGGLSGPAIRPIAVHITYQVAQAVAIPVIGAGGVTSAHDALEFLMAGAPSGQVGAPTLAGPPPPLRGIQGPAGYRQEKGPLSTRDGIRAGVPPPEPDD